MAKADTKEHLKQMIKVLNDEFARGQLDKQRQIVTLEFNNTVEAWKEGYSNLIKAQVKKGVSFKPSKDINWEKGVRDAWPLIANSIKKSKGTVREFTPSIIVFTETKTTKSMYKNIKGHLVDFVQKELGTSKFTAAEDEVSALKNGIHRLHKENTSVGSARLALSMKWMSKTRFFKDFMSSKEATQIQDKYGDLLATWKTKGTKRGGFKISPKESIKLSLAAASTNKRGDEPEDFSNIYRELKKSITKWARNAEIAGRKGSISIKDNAVNMTEFVVAGHLGKVKNAKVKKKTTNSKRTAKSTSISIAGKSMSSSRKAKARIAQRKKATATAMSSSLSILAMIQKELTQTVRDNMEAPALENRTGRFSESVRVTDIMSTSQGFPSIGYTYDKQPYQVFEMGAGSPPWATPERDPRRLIDRSIREIASGLALGRFYTRRV